MSQARNLKESLRSEEYKKLEAIFSEAEAFFMNHFIRTGSGEGYGGNKTISPHTSEWVRDVLMIMRFFVDLKNLDYYERSLKQKVVESHRYG